jgi:hypothetical protein
VTGVSRKPSLGATVGTIARNATATSTLKDVLAA